MNPVAVTPPKRATSRRAQERKPLQLLEHSVTRGTYSKYKSAVIQFVEWAVENGEDPQDEDQLDGCLHEYIQWLYDDGGSRSLASNAIAGLGFFIPRLRNFLPIARLALRGWTRLEPVRSHPPLTWELTCLLAGHLSEKSPRLARLGIGIILGFDCLLRVSELVNLRTGDVAFIGDERIGVMESKEPLPPGGLPGRKKSALVFVRKSKTGKNQWVELHSPEIIQLLRGLVGVTKAGDLLFPYSASVVRGELKAACAFFGLTAGYVPHSLRHGGASWYRRFGGMSVEDVAERGRWASCKSARIYINAGIALLAATKVPSELHLLGVSVAKLLFQVLDIRRRRA
jgi:integrase